MIKKILILLLIITTLVSCKSTKNLQSSINTSVSVKDSISEKEYVTKKDTSFPILADSARTIIYINCDSLNNPKITQEFIDQGQKIKMNYSFKNDKTNPFEKNQTIPLYVNCKIDSSSVAFSYYNTHKEKFVLNKTDSSIVKTILVPVEKKLSKWKGLMIKIGTFTFWLIILLLGLLLGYGTFRLLRLLKYIP